MPILLVVDDDRAVHLLFRAGFRESDVEVVSAASVAEALDLLPRCHPDAVILDIALPDGDGLEAFERVRQFDGRLPVIFITGIGTSETAIQAMKRGGFDYLVKPLDLSRVRTLVGQAFESRRFMHVPVKWVDLGPPNAVSDVLVGQCAAMQEVYKSIGRVSSRKVNVLIRGESGTGKELVARAIYQHGPRAQGQFLAVNCAAIPETLLESELFGHEKGSFTGAEARRIGKFEQCSGGTLFLDEVGDMTPLMQSKVLRVLQEQGFERVGGNETIHTDVWIVAATNRDLEEMVANGQFRADLYYRLNGFSIKLPALREREEDVPLLVEHFLRLYSYELNKEICDVHPRAVEMLLGYRWPGNVRELQSVLRQALLHSVGPVLLPEFLPSEIRENRAVDSPEARGTPVAIESFVDERLRMGRDGLYDEALAFMERILLARVLRHVGGNQSRAAKILGITRSSLRNKLRTLNISVNQLVQVGAHSDESEPCEV